MPSRNSAVKLGPVAKRFANTTGSAEFDTAPDITQLRPGSLMRQTTPACQSVRVQARRYYGNKCKQRAAFFVSARDEESIAVMRRKMAETPALSDKKRATRRWL